MTREGSMSIRRWCLRMGRVALLPQLHIGSVTRWWWYYSVPVSDAGSSVDISCSSSGPTTFLRTHQIDCWWWFVLIIWFCLYYYLCSILLDVVAFSFNLRSLIHNWWYQWFWCRYVHRYIMFKFHYLLLLNIDCGGNDQYNKYNNNNNNNMWHLLLIVGPSHDNYIPLFLNPIQYTFSYIYFECWCCWCWRWCYYWYVPRLLLRFV